MWILKFWLSFGEVAQIIAHQILNSSTLSERGRWCQNCRNSLTAKDIKRTVSRSQWPWPMTSTFYSVQRSTPVTRLEMHRIRRITITAFEGGWESSESVLLVALKSSSLPVAAYWCIPNIISLVSPKRKLILQSFHGAVCELHHDVLLGFSLLYFFVRLPFDSDWLLTLSPALRRSVCGARLWPWRWSDCRWTLRWRPRWRPPPQACHPGWQSHPGPRCAPACLSRPW